MNNVIINIHLNENQLSISKHDPSKAIIEGLPSERRTSGATTPDVLKLVEEVLSSSSTPLRRMTL